MSFVWSSKDPDEVYEYTHNWNARLDGDTIDTCEVIVESGSITITDQFFTGPVQTIWVSGGVESETVVLTIRINTIGGRIFDEGVKLKIKSR